MGRSFQLLKRRDPQTLMEEAGQLRTDTRQARQQPLRVDVPAVGPQRAELACADEQLNRVRQARADAGQLLQAVPAARPAPRRRRFGASPLSGLRPNGSRSACADFTSRSYTPQRRRSSPALVS